MSSLTNVIIFTEGKRQTKVSTIEKNIDASMNFQKGQLVFNYNSIMTCLFFLTIYYGIFLPKHLCGPVSLCDGKVFFSMSSDFGTLTKFLLLFLYCAGFNQVLVSLFAGIYLRTPKMFSSMVSSIQDRTAPSHPSTQNITVIQFIASIDLVLLSS